MSNPETKEEALLDTPPVAEADDDADDLDDDQVVPTLEVSSSYDFNAPELYLNRELTWLNFNRRVLHEAADERTKLLERIKFIAIVCSNMDEFFMKRIGGLKQQLGAGLSDLTVDGRTPQQQIDQSNSIIHEIEQEKQTLYKRLVFLLARNHIDLLDYDDLTRTEKQEARKKFYNNVFPLVTPQSIDPAHPFPFISNLSLNLLVKLRQGPEAEEMLARVKVPVGQDVPRFMKLGNNSFRFVRVEDVMSANIDLLFPKMQIVSVEKFRVTRNAVTELDEEQADDLLNMIETELRYRKFASVVRLQVEPGMDPIHKGKLAAELGLDEAADVFEVNGIMGKRDLMEIAGVDIPHLKDPPHHPIDHPRLKDVNKIFYKLRDSGPMLVFHPYESFSSSVERFLFEASQDPKVRAIKMTLYRTSRDSKVIKYLIEAARNGKQVAAVVELKARFDEAANIGWANRLEEAGIHVTYGVVGYKTHSKVILVVRRDFDGLRRYAHIGTGNYHSGTARLYTDFGMLTCDETIGQDLTEFFNYLSTGFTPKRNYRKLLIAPSDMKRAMITKIQREINVHSKEKPGLIIFKMNALEDPDITRELYKATHAGVHVRLIVRDTCRFRPGVEGLSESGQVISIVGRFLEHARAYYFQNDGDEEFFIGSADFMKRNLESRVEVLVPVEDPTLRKEMHYLLDMQLKDQRNAWEMQSDGTYVQRKAVKGRKGSQALMVEVADKRQKAATTIKRIKSRGKSKKEFWHSY